jgi:hypothetical protein
MTFCVLAGFFFSFSGTAFGISSSSDFPTMVSGLVLLLLLWLEEDEEEWDRVVRPDKRDERELRRDSMVQVVPSESEQMSVSESEDALFCCLARAAW